MAIAVELSFYGPSATRRNYNKSIAIMGATPGGPHPDPGCRFHWMTETDLGFRVTDVWKTKAKFEKFAAEKLGPVSTQVGLPQPEVKFVKVANFLIAGS